MTRHVHWTAEEREQVLSTAAEMLYGGYARSRIAAFNLANATMPDDRRRRPVQTVTKETWFTEGIDRHLARLRDLERQREAEAAAPPPPPPPPAPDALLQAVKALLVAVLRSPEGQAVIRAAMPEAIGAAPVAEPAPPAPPKAPRKPVVLIVGLLPAQQKLVEEEYRDRFDLRCLGSNDKRSRMRELAHNADKTIAMVGFVNHDVTESLKRAAVNYSQVSGGMTDLRRVLTMFAHPPAAIHAAHNGVAHPHAHTHTRH